MVVTHVEPMNFKRILVAFTIIFDLTNHRKLHILMIQIPTDIFNAIRNNAAGQYMKFSSLLSIYVRIHRVLGCPAAASR